MRAVPEFVPWGSADPNLAHVFSVQVLRAYLAAREQRPVDWLGGLADSKIKARRENGGRLADERETEQLKALGNSGTEGEAHLSQGYKS
jgi:hypothetical protein